MSSWGHEQTAVARGEPRPRTPADLFVEIRQSQPFSEKSYYLGYALGEHQNKREAVIFSKQLVMDAEPWLRFAGVGGSIQLHMAGLRDGEKLIGFLIKDSEPRIRKTVAEHIHLDRSDETRRVLIQLSKDDDVEIRSLAVSKLSDYDDLEVFGDVT